MWATFDESLNILVLSILPYVGEHETDNNGAYVCTTYINKQDKAINVHNASPWFYVIFYFNSRDMQNKFALQKCELV